ncbi:PAQR family membrane homeostasis protein TrhA [Sulfitobacter sp. JB4-11]|uniref:PAQR family membrane homeostasis protein TrhA n=1 Tax=Sulfitobacter rhodophyticola TaxID=3238304 RepID=UPI0035141E6F
MTYPNSPSETLADGAVHLAGLALSIPACLLVLHQLQLSGSAVTGFATYAASLILAFGASALYHMSPFERPRAVLHRIDHAAIYLKIAGTYTPFVALIGTGFAYGVLAIVWALAGLGALAKLWFWPPNARGSLALYLGMGWLAVLLIWPMAQALPGSALVLIVVGGLIYSAGTWVFAHPGMRYQNAIWHGFVLTASICFFAAVALSL